MRGSSDESPFYVSEKEREMSMEIYLITAGALFLFYYGILCFYTGKWKLYVCQILAGGGDWTLFDHSATKEEVTRALCFLLARREYGSFFLPWSFLLYVP